MPQHHIPSLVLLQFTLRKHLACLPSILTQRLDRLKHSHLVALTLAPSPPPPVDQINNIDVRVSENLSLYISLLILFNAISQ